MLRGVCELPVLTATFLQLKHTLVLLNECMLLYHLREFYLKAENSVSVINYQINVDLPFLLAAHIKWRRNSTNQRRR